MMRLSLSSRPGAWGVRIGFRVGQHRYGERKVKRQDLLDLFAVQRKLSVTEHANEFVDHLPACQGQSRIPLAKSIATKPTHRL